MTLFASSWTTDDILLMDRAGAVSLSRDGSKLLWLQARMDKKSGKLISHIHLRYLADGHTTQLTRGTESANAPLFSPDGNRVGFLTSRKDDGGADGAEGGAKPQVWVLDLRGGEPQAVTTLDQGVNSFRWIDNDNLLLVAQETPTARAQKIKEDKDTSRVVDDPEEAPIRLFRFSLKDKKAKRISRNEDRIARVEVSWDGRYAVAIHNRSSRYVFDAEIPPVTFLYDLQSESAEQLFAGTRTVPGSIQWTLSNDGFYYTADYSNHPIYRSASITKLYFLSLADKKPVEMNLDWERGVTGDISITEKGLFVPLANGVRDVLAHYRREGNNLVKEDVTGEHVSNIFGVKTSVENQVVAYEYSTASVPAQWFTAKLQGTAFTDVKKATSLNGSLEKKPISKTETVHWKGALGEEVEGLLYYPHDYQSGKKYPLVVMIHGGPASLDKDAFRETWAYPHQLYTQRGAFILKPNYHGSSNYGLAWVESIGEGKYNDLEWQDVETGVDALIAKGIVDPDKMGVMGWSNGSIISIEISTRTTRYKAVGAGAGNVNWISDWGNAMFGHSFDNYYLGATPMSNPERYVAKSPLFRMDKVKSPTIIFFGTDDVNVPTEQGWQHYRALQHLANTDVKFLLFPGEPHSLQKYAHQKRKVDEELAWFDKFLFQKDPGQNAWLKEDSPLSGLLRRSTLSEVPEVAQLGDLQVGRFEITRSQYAAFDKSYRIPAGTGNYPATGISFDKAKQYAEWLSKRSGKKFRLPTEKEMSGHLSASKKGNTLDRWAGYDVNPDDAARLATAIAKLSADDLLMPVGSFGGKGSDPVFDLDGNAAEWVVTEQGTGKLLGGSADRPADTLQETAPRADFAGFRVVLD